MKSLTPPPLGVGTPSISPAAVRAATMTHLGEIFLHMFHFFLPELLLSLVQNSHDRVIHLLNFFHDFGACILTNIIYRFHVFLNNRLKLLPLLRGELQFLCNAFNHPARHVFRGGRQ